MAVQICREHIWTAKLARREKDRSPFQSSLRDDLWRVDVGKPRYVLRQGSQRFSHKIFRATGKRIILLHPHHLISKTLIKRLSLKLQRI